jgi:hypothetical protein
MNRLASYTLTLLLAVLLIQDGNGSRHLRWLDMP